MAITTRKELEEYRGALGQTYDQIQRDAVANNCIHLLDNLELTCIEPYLGEDAEKEALHLLLSRIKSFKELHDLLAYDRMEMLPIEYRLLDLFRDKIGTLEDAIWLFKSYPRLSHGRSEMARTIATLATPAELKQFVIEIFREEARLKKRYCLSHMRIYDTSLTDQRRKDFLEEAAKAPYKPLEVAA